MLLTGITEIVYKIKAKILGKRINRLFYIGGADVLPPPMTAEEEKKYVSGE